MANVSSNQVTQKSAVKVDPNNFLPPGIIGVEYKEIPGPPDNAVTSGEAQPTQDSTGDGVDFSDMQIVSQTLKAAPGGKWVVDVVLSVPDRKGTTAWDVRLTRV